MILPPAFRVRREPVTSALAKQVAGFARSDVVAADKLKSTDGIYGIRFANNTDATMTNFKKTKTP